MRQAQFEPTFESWRKEAREFLAQNISPDQILWSMEEEPSLFLDFNHRNESFQSCAEVFQVPTEFLELARFVSCHSDVQRWSLLYRLLYRLKNESKSLLSITTDAEVHKAKLMMKSVTKDIHKMHAFVRFKRVHQNGEDFFIAWHKPEHFIVEEATPFFQRRFGDKAWCILTPHRSAFWDLKTLRFGEGVPQHMFDVKDDFDQLWQSYYASIFNLARLNLRAMKKEMAPKYWSSLPEAQVIRGLIEKAPERLQAMVRNHNTQAVVPERVSVGALSADLQLCRACPLYQQATRVVTGEGPNQAELMIVGEQPGDQEDLAGRPFVGPAGSVLENALSLAGLERKNLYLTNAVKHFKYEPQGKARIHKRASGTEMHACKPWLEAEVRLVKPKIILALGVTAGTALLGRQPKIGEERGRLISFPSRGYSVILSWHPASILRAFDADEANKKAMELSQDLTQAKLQLQKMRFEEKAVEFS